MNNILIITYLQFVELVSMNFFERNLIPVFYEVEEVSFRSSYLMLNIRLGTSIVHIARMRN